MKKCWKIIILFLILLLIGCEKEVEIAIKEEPVKKEKIKEKEQSNYLWVDDYAYKMEYLQLEEKGGVLIALLTTSELDDNFALKKTTVSLNGTRIGNTFSIKTEEDTSEIAISGKIEKKSVIVHEEGYEGEKVFTKVSEEEYDEQVENLKMKIDEMLEKNAIDMVSHYYFNNSPNPQKGINFETAFKEGNYFEIKSCVKKSEECIYENSFSTWVGEYDVYPSEYYPELTDEQKNIEFDLLNNEKKTAEQLAEKYFYKVNGKTKTMFFESQHWLRNFIVVYIYEDTSKEEPYDFYGVNIYTDEINDELYHGD